MSGLKFKLLRFLVNIIAVIYLVFDEIFVYLSTKLNELIFKIKSFEVLVLKFNDLLYRTNRYFILIYFLILLVVSELIGIYAFVALSHANIAVFIFLYIIKFIPFFVLNYIFKQTKEKLLSISWFNYMYFKVTSIAEYLKNTEIAIRCKQIIANLKEKIKNFKI